MNPPIKILSGSYTTFIHIFIASYSPCFSWLIMIALLRATSEWIVQYSNRTFKTGKLTSRQYVWCTKTSEKAPDYYSNTKLTATCVNLWLSLVFAKRCLSRRGFEIDDAAHWWPCKQQLTQPLINYTSFLFTFELNFVTV